MNRRFERGVALFLAAILVSLLGSCGSGAVTAPPPTDPAAGTPVAVSPPTADLFPDLPTTFTVTGGKPAYQAFSSNSAALPIDAAVVGSTFTAVARAVTADTAVDITVRDAANAATTSKVTIKPSSLNNQISLTPFAPTATGCGNNAVCSGGDAQVVVKAVQNGILLRNRAIRFDVFQGSFQLVTPGSGVRVNSLSVNTDDLGNATARLTVAAGAPTQVATIQTLDTVTGLLRRFNFNIVQETSGAGILSSLPSGKVTFKGAKGLPGQDGSCPSSGFARVDFYIFGGTPPYSIASPLPALAAASPEVISFNGGSFTALLNGCGSTAFIVRDSTGRTVETAIVEGVQGDKGDAVTTTTTPFSVTPQSLSIACGTSGSVSLTGVGSFTAVRVSGGGAGFSVVPSTGVLIAGAATSVTFTAGTGPVSSPVNYNFVVGTSIAPVAITVSGTNVAGNCP